MYVKIKDIETTSLSPSMAIPASPTYLKDINSSCNCLPSIDRQPLEWKCFEGYLEIRHAIKWIHNAKNHILKQQYSTFIKE